MLTGCDCAGKIVWVMPTLYKATCTYVILTEIVLPSSSLVPLEKKDVMDWVTDTERFLLLMVHVFS